MYCKTSTLWLCPIWPSVKEPLFGYTAMTAYTTNLPQIRAAAACKESTCLERIFMSFIYTDLLANGYRINAVWLGNQDKWKHCSNISSAWTGSKMIRSTTWLRYQRPVPANHHMHMYRWYILTEEVHKFTKSTFTIMAELPCTITLKLVNFHLHGNRSGQQKLHTYITPKCKALWITLYTPCLRQCHMHFYLHPNQDIWKTLAPPTKSRHLRPKPTMTGMAWGV